LRRHNDIKEAPLLNDTVRALQEDVAAVASLGDPAVAAAGERISRALEGNIRSRLLDLLQAAAQELDAQLPAGRVSVRLEGGEPRLVYEPAAESTLEPAADEDAGSARLTVRLPASLKEAAERAASRESLSLNGWMTRAVKRALDGPGGGAGRRLQGWARS
jgi:hypothetical protein